MERNLDDRAYELAVYMLEHDATVRAAAAKFGVSKSTVHKDLTERLRRRAPALHAAVRALLDRNKAERHIRGGMATKRKYENQKTD
ncbi:MAG: sporulation transcriptional regulator SpoIIID [Ruminococcus sp.]|nr:sporulation transcriptional regulator SpoIIID [Ruminococcus sp.]